MQTSLMFNNESLEAESNGPGNLKVTAGHGGRLRVRQDILPSLEDLNALPSIGPGVRVRRRCKLRIRPSSLISWSRSSQQSPGR